MKVMQWFLGLIAAFSLIIIILIGSIEIATYADFSFYQKEYEKYNVKEDVKMEIEDIMEVTKEMMSYLKGKRADLVVHTVVDGEEREFFNDKEKAHMRDVQQLFLQGLQLRMLLIIVFIIAIGLLIVLKADLKKILPWSYQIGTGLFLLITGGLVLLFSTDFTKYFTKFHEMFFTNDLWLLDPATDLMINILPEGFFMDTAARIGIIFAVIMVLTLAISILFTVWIRKNKKINN